jgi:hypothetical protein
MVPFGVTITATVPQGSEIPEGLMKPCIKMYIRDVDVSRCPVFSTGLFTAVVNNEKLPNSLEHMYSWGVNSSLAFQVVTHTLIYYYVWKSPTIDPFQSQMNPANILTLYFIKILLIWYLCPHGTSSILSLSLSFSIEVLCKFIYSLQAARSVYSFLICSL